LRAVLKYHVVTCYQRARFVPCHSGGPYGVIS